MKCAECVEHKEYRVRLVDAGGTYQNDHIQAKTPQEAADQIRREYKGCYIVSIAEVVYNWE